MSGLTLPLALGTRPTIDTPDNEILTAATMVIAFMTLMMIAFMTLPVLRHGSSCVCPQVRRPDWELPELHAGLQLAPSDVLWENKRSNCGKW